MKKTKTRSRPPAPHKTKGQKTRKTDGEAKKRRKKAKDIPGPVWIRPPGDGPLHPEIDKQIAKPFLSSIYLDGETGCFRFPIGNGKVSHPHGGLHARMNQKLLPKLKKEDKERARRGRFVIPGKQEPTRLASSKEMGSRADRVLAEAIRSGNPPPEPGSQPRGTCEYASAIWEYWENNGHVPVLSQLPVVLIKANIITAGDYFTVKDGKLWLWELKTGWPETPQHEHIMRPPLEHVWATKWNEWQLQLIITKMAYERELGMVIDEARVIHAWKERPFGILSYSVKVSVVSKEDLDPPDWPEITDKNRIYEAL